MGLFIMSNIALPANVQTVIDVYNEKIASLESDYNKIKSDIDANIDKMVGLSCVMGKHHDQFSVISPKLPFYEDCEKGLKIATWRKIEDITNFQDLATAQDIERYEASLSNPPVPTIETAVAAFGSYVSNPRESILRGLAEQFSKLDPFYKSHTNFGVGKKGLPKRVVMDHTVDCYGIRYEYKNKFLEFLKPLSLLLGWPMPTYANLESKILLDDYGRNTNKLMIHIKMDGGHYWSPPENELSFKAFKKASLHIAFGRTALNAINGALAEYYGEAIPNDVQTDKRQSSTEVSKDLAYYPTPKAVIDKMLRSVNFAKHHKVLEPSCGDGRILSAMRENGTSDILGVEVHSGRAAKSRAKGHSVINDNFLTLGYKDMFDIIVMNPPFSGKHYLKHMQAAWDALKKDGYIVALLPASAWYDKDKQKLLKQIGGFRKYVDIKPGAFKESGTNVCTVIVQARKAIK